MIAMIFGSFPNFDLVIRIVQRPETLLNAPEG